MEQAKIMQQIEAAATIQMYLLEHSAHDPKACMKDLKRLSRYIKNQCKQLKQSQMIHLHEHSDDIKPAPTESVAKGFDCLVDKLLSPSKAATRESVPVSSVMRELSNNITFNLSYPPSPIRGLQENSQDGSCFDMLSSINDWGELKAYLNRGDEDSLDFEAAERAAMEAVKVASPPASPASASRTSKAITGTPEALKARLRARPVSRGSLTPILGDTTSVQNISPAMRTGHEELPPGSCAQSKKSGARPLMNKMDLRQVSEYVIQP